MRAAEVFFGSLEHGLNVSALRLDKRARPISFELLDDDDPEIWSFVPSRKERLFVQGVVDSPALTVTCRTSTLIRFLRQQDAEIQADEPMLIEGDPSALDCLIKNLGATRSAVALRAEKPSKGKKR